MIETGAERRRSGVDMHGYRIRLPALTIASLAAMIAGNAVRAQQAPPRDSDIYARVENRLAHDPALAAAIGRAPVELARLGWMLGSWSVEARTMTSSSTAPAELGASTVQPVMDGAWLEIVDRYPGGTQDIGYLTYNLATRRWISVTIDSLGNANAIFSDGWEGNRIIFEGDMIVVGLFAHLRQTITKISDSEYRVRNEERVGHDWRTLDDYHYRKVADRTR